jgi:hypothetical protein
MSQHHDEPPVRLAHHKPIVLNNQFCVYCGVELTIANSTKEHVIGRKFVPMGKLDKAWNLIVRACRACNNAKSNLEDDISAITMQPSMHGQHVIDDHALAAEAVRKAKSRSRKTKKAVSDSNESLTVKVPFGPAMMTFNMVAPAQVDQERIFELCKFHITGFYFWLTYSTDMRRGYHYLPGGMAPLLETPRADWGNLINVAFMQTVKTWVPSLITSSADGFFKAEIRRHPSSGLRSWALEWNHNYRIIGFFGDHHLAQQIVDTFPDNSPHPIKTAGNEQLRVRLDVAFDESQDTMFTWLEDTDSSDSLGEVGPGDTGAEKL